jgi:hypothetical protein
LTSSASSEISGSFESRMTESSAIVMLADTPTNRRIAAVATVHVISSRRFSRVGFASSLFLNRTTV